MKKLNIIILLLTIVMSCTNKNKVEHLFLEEQNAKNVYRPQKTYIKNFKKLFEIDSFNDIPFSSPWKIQIYDNKIYLLDNDANCIYSFDANGKSLNVFGKKGKGPGEFYELKDFAISDKSIYCLDKNKMTITKFNLNNKFIFEKKIPSEIMQNISPENIEICQNRLIISGFNISNFNDKKSFILYSFNKDFKKTTGHLSLSEIFKKLSFNEKILRTGNVIDCNNNELYIGMFVGPVLFYKYDIRNNKITYRVILNNKKREKVTILNNNSGSEFLTYFNTVNISVNDKFIVLSEDAGGTSKKGDVNKRKDYFNNISFYKKNGEYICSFKDDDIPYSVYGLNCAAELIDNNLILYVSSIETGKLYKYLIKDFHL